MTGEDVEEIATAVLWLFHFAAEGADDVALVNCIKPAVEMLEQNGVSPADFADALERQGGVVSERVRRVVAHVRTTLA